MSVLTPYMHSLTAGPDNTFMKVTIHTVHRKLFKMRKNDLKERMDGIGKFWNLLLKSCLAYGKKCDFLVKTLSELQDSAYRSHNYSERLILIRIDFHFLRKE